MPEKTGRKAIFLDGFPRDLDQISYSLYFRQIMNLRDDPDFFVLISTPESILHERIIYRRVCPLCQNSRNLKLNPTKFVRWDKDKNKPLLLCDNQMCEGFGKQVMGEKEGGEQGIAAIKDRLELDDNVTKKVSGLQGVRKIFLQNAVGVGLPAGQAGEASQLYAEYEITPKFDYEFDSNSGKIEVIKSSWVVKDEQGREFLSLMPAAVVLSLILQVQNLLLF